MEQELTPDPDYIKSFNDGYLISKYRLELAEKLSESLKGTKNGDGFRDGKNQYREEANLDRYPPWMTRDRNNENTPEKGKSKDDLEKEKD